MTLLQPTSQDFADGIKNYIDSIVPDNVKSNDDNDLVERYMNTKNSKNLYDEWQTLFGKVNITQLSKLGISGHLRNCRYRSVIWQLYLNVISQNSDDWVNEISDCRRFYNNLKIEYIIDPRTSQVNSPTNDDPLSSDNESRWNQYFKSQDTMKEIKQDVVRTFPEIEFFHDNKIRQIMINILYCYTQYFELPYRQGMHEILAPILFVLHCDHMSHQHACEIIEKRDVNNGGGSAAVDVGGELFHTITVKLLNSIYLENDAFSIFSNIMTVIEPWYETTDNSFKHDAASREMFKMGMDHNSIRRNIVNSKPFEKPKEILPECKLLKKINHIHDDILKQYDLDLYLHLEKLEISPQMFGLRWLRLLFGREFTMQDLLLVWDLIFAIYATSSPEDSEVTDFVIVEHLYVAMLIHIRDILLPADFTNCLTKLMRYPKGVDVSRIIEYALHLYQPDLYPQPWERLYPRSAGYTQQSLTINSSSRRKRSDRNKTIVGLEIFTNKMANLMNKKSNSGDTDAVRPLGYSRSGVTQRPMSLYQENDYRQQRYLTQQQQQQRPPSVSDSAPVTPTNQQQQQIAAATPLGTSLSDSANNYSFGNLKGADEYVNINIDTTDSNNYHQAISSSIQLLNKSLVNLKSNPLTGQSVEEAISFIIHARELLQTGLGMDSKTVASKLQAMKHEGHSSVSNRNTSGSGGGGVRSTNLNRSVSSNDIASLLKSERARDGSFNSTNNAFVDFSDRFMKIFPTTMTYPKQVELKDISSNRNFSTYRRD